MTNIIHCIGIGGIGVSALAQVLSAHGFTVQGSDKERSKIFGALKQQGIKAYAKHDRRLITKKIGAVIYSLAIQQNHPELVKARALKIPIMSYPQALGELTKAYKTIAVCGTHGKTTTTAMLAKILIDAKLDPTVIVGSIVPELNNSNYRVGKSNLLVIEACEYQRGFLNLHPFGIVLTTIDYDHFDTYPTHRSYIAAFRSFIAKIPKDGFVVKNTVINSHIKLAVPGIHNKKNAGAALLAAKKLGVSESIALTSLKKYKGSARRLEYKGTRYGARFYDDYAHHPTEIKATLEAARELFPKEKICVIYQPHQYNRTKRILKALGTSFVNADFVIIPNIYEARDTAKDKKAITAQDVVKEISKHKGNNAIAGGGLAKTRRNLKKYCKSYDVVITMGAGDVWKIL